MNDTGKLTAAYYSRLVMAFMDCFPGFREFNESRAGFNA